jgi:hypothetical protein
MEAHIGLSSSLKDKMAADHREINKNLLRFRKNVFAS